MISQIMIHLRKHALPTYAAIQLSFEHTVHTNPVSPAVPLMSGHQVSWAGRKQSATNIHQKEEAHKKLCHISIVTLCACYGVNAWQWSAHVLATSAAQFESTSAPSQQLPAEGTALPSGHSR